MPDGDVRLVPDVSRDGWRNRLRGLEKAGMHPADVVVSDDGVRRRLKIEPPVAEPARAAESDQVDPVDLGPMRLDRLGEKGRAFPGRLADIGRGGRAHGDRWGQRAEAGEEGAAVDHAAAGSAAPAHAARSAASSPSNTLRSAPFSTPGTVCGNGPTPSPVYCSRVQSSHGGGTRMCALSPARSMPGGRPSLYWQSQSGRALK